MRRGNVATFRGLGRGSWYDVRRGLVHTVCCTPDEWLEHGPTIVRHPLSVVEVVKLDRPPRRVEIPPQVWVWPLVGVVASDEGLPYPLWYAVHGPEAGGGEWFKTRKQAAEELSTRFIAWAWNPDLRRPTEVPRTRERRERTPHDLRSPGDDRAAMADGIFQHVDRSHVLDHCRGLGVHVQGCWVIDLILGKS
jgi:hypothetical protein